MINLGNADPGDKRNRMRNQVYQTAVMSLQRWINYRCEDMKNQIIDTALANGFFSVWMEVFRNEPIVLNALISRFPGTEKRYFDSDGKAKPELV